MNGKGSKPRPLSVPYEVFADNHDSIFRKKDKKFRVIETKTDTNGDIIIEFPDDILKDLGWKQGDTIDWVEDGQGYLLKKNLT